MAEIMCATCGAIGKHYPWCAVGQLNADVAELTEAVATRDRLAAGLEVENERLRKAVENAPHDPMCGTRFVWDKPRCNCWKQAALAGEVK